MPALPETFTVLAPGRPGIGDPAIPVDGLNLKHPALGIHGLARPLGFEKARVVGHNIGLMAGYAYAARVNHFPQNLSISGLAVHRRRAVHRGHWMHDREMLPLPREGGASDSRASLVPDRHPAWRILRDRIVDCRACPRLVRYREEVGRVRRRAFLDQDYWSRPLPGFGDLSARIVVIGLAPAAHGGNRTGRVFTGDRSADFLIRAMWENGFANQPESIASDDGLTLQDAYLTLPVRCAPPGNKPSRDEFENCRGYLVRELALLRSVRVVIVLGSIALNAYLDILKDRGAIASRSPFRFAHGAHFVMPGEEPAILASYHPSQQNTFTGRLTSKMLSEVFQHARRVIEERT